MLVKTSELTGVALDWANGQYGCSGNDECHGCHNDEELTIARAAIAKARGEL